MKILSNSTRNTRIKGISIVASCFAVLLSILLVNCKEKPGSDEVVESTYTVHPEDWREIAPLPLDPTIEARIDEILPKLTLEQKVGQVIQADNASVTP